MSEPRSKAKTKVTIVINQRPYHLDHDEATGQDLKLLAEIPVENLLFKEVPGPADDVQINDDDVVALKSGEHFYDMPRGNFGARW